MTTVGSVNGNGKTVWKALEISILILVGVNTSLTSWALSKLVSFESRVSSIEANRFTAKDGIEVWRAIALKADAADVPPQEVRDRLAELGSRIERLEDRNARGRE